MRAGLCLITLLGAGCARLWGPYAGDNPAFTEPDLGGGGGGGEGSDGGAGGVGFTPVKSGVTFDLTSVSGVRASLVWAVGTQRTLLVWEGAAWRKLDSGGVQAEITVIAGVPGTDSAWIGGDQGWVYGLRDAGLFALSRPSLVAVTGIWAGDEKTAFAVKADGNALRQVNGTTWELLDTGSTIPLRDVWGTGASDVWAVGDGGVTLRWDGARWMGRPTLSNTSRFNGVWAQGDQRLAVGPAAVAIWNGDAAPTRPYSTAAELHDIWGSGPKDIWAVGEHGLILHWDGVAVSTVASGTEQRLRGIWGSGPGDLWVVGEGGTILHSTPR